MNKSNPVQQGFFKRLLNYFNTIRYEKKRLNKEKYLVNWDKIKWRYRFGKIAFICTFYFVGNYLLVSKNIDRVAINEEKEKMVDQYKSFISSNWNKFDDPNYFKQLKQSTESLSKFFESEIELAGQLNLKENLANEFIVNITKILTQNLQNNKIIQNNENFKFINFLDEKRNIILNVENQKDFLSKIILGSYRRKYDKNDYPKDIDKAVIYSEYFIVYNI
jgi:hypothetical protein